MLKKIKVNLYLLCLFFYFLKNIKKINLNLTNLKEISILTKIEKINVLLFEYVFIYFYLINS